MVTTDRELVATEIRCACHDHLISLESWDDEAYMSLWTPIHSKEWGRFHWVWQSLKGRWNGDNEVVLDQESATKLRDALSDHLTRVKRS